MIRSADGKVRVFTANLDDLVAKLGFFEKVDDTFSRRQTIDGGGRLCGALSATRKGDKCIESDL